MKAIVTSSCIEKRQVSHAGGEPSEVPSFCRCYLFDLVIRHLILLRTEFKAAASGCVWWCFLSVPQRDLRII